MNNHQNGSARRHQRGFTLVEIGVVLVIIGLLLGAVLKGQELIASARVSNLISSMNGYKAAINAFQDRYRMMPGDSSTAAAKVGSGAVNCTVSCDDGLIDNWPNVSLVNNHLGAAGFYSGPALTAETNALPTSTGYLTNPGGGTIYLQTTADFVTLTGVRSPSPATTVVVAGKLSSKFFGELDRKVDDGNGWTGGMRATWVSRGCVSSTTGVWIESNPAINCEMLELLY